MRIVELDPRQRQLLTMYQPQEPGRIMPSELSDEIVLVHPAAPFGAELDGTNMVALDVLAPTLFAAGSEPAPDTFWWVHAIHGSHNDPAARDLRLELFHVFSGNAVVLAVGLAQAQNVELLGPGRSILIPRGWLLRTRVSALAGGSSVSLRYMELRNEAAEMPPYL